MCQVRMARQEGEPGLVELLDGGVPSVLQKPQADSGLVICHIPAEPILPFTQLSSHSRLAKAEKMWPEATNCIFGNLSKDETPKSPNCKISKLSVQLCRNPENLNSPSDRMGPPLSSLS